MQLYERWPSTLTTPRVHATRLAGRDVRTEGQLTPSPVRAAQGASAASAASAANAANAASTLLRNTKRVLNSAHNLQVTEGFVHTFLHRGMM